MDEFFSPNQFDPAMVAAIHQGRARARYSYEDDELFDLLLASLDFDLQTKIFILIPVHVTEQRLGQCISTLQKALKYRAAHVLFCINYHIGEFPDDELMNLLATMNSVLASYPPTYGDICIRHFVRGLRHSAGMGDLRSFMCDIIIEYCRRRRCFDAILVFQDSDLLEIAEEYVAEVAASFAKTSSLALLGCSVHYGYIGTRAVGLPRGIEVPELFLFQRFSSALSYCLREGLVNYERRVWPEGANFAMSSWAYTLVGGFNPNLASSEDDGLGRLVHKFKRIDGPIQQRLRTDYCERAWLVTDPRRVLRAICSGLPGIEAWAWDDFSGLLGSSMRTEEIARLCDESASLLTTFELRRAAIGDLTAVSKMRSRVTSLFLAFVDFDRRAQSAAHVTAWAAKAGLVIRSIEEQYGRYAIDVEWESSVLEEELLELGSRSEASSAHVCTK